MALDQAINLNPAYPPAHNNRAAILLDFWDAAQALAAADRAIALVPDFAEALNNKGLALLDLKDQSAAFEKFDMLRGLIQRMRLPIITRRASIGSAATMRRQPRRIGIA